VHFMLGQVKFHGILEYQRDILSQGGRVSQVLVITVQLRSVSHIVEAHRGLDNLGVVGYDVLDRVLEYEVLIFLREILDHLPNQL
jgi:hypothetical protein